MQENQNPVDKKKSGCGKFIFWIIGCFAAMFLLEILLNWIFTMIYPPDELAKSLVPFQNHFHAFTSYFVTSEDLTSEFTNDVVATARMITYSIVAVLGSFVVSAFLYMIPKARKLLDNVVYILFIPTVALAVAYSLFFPPTKTVFDKQAKEIIITQHSWIFIPKTEHIPFDQITKIDHRLYDDGGHYGDNSHNVFAFIYAHAGNRKIFIGENQMPSHSASEKNWKARLDSTQVVNATQAIRQIVGLNQ